MKLAAFLKLLSEYDTAGGVQLCVLRNYASLPDENTANDIDFIYPYPHDGITFIRHATLDMDGVSITGFCDRDYVLSIFLHGVEWGEGKRSLQVDFLKKCSWKGVPYLDCKNVTRDSARLRADCPWLRRPSPHHEAIISFLSSYLVGGWIKQRYQKSVRKAFESHDMEIRTVLRERFSSALVDRLVDAVVRDDHAQLMTMLPALRTSLVTKALMRRPFASLAAIRRHAVSELGIYFLAHKLRTEICILGPDGSGKSTLIENLTDYLSNAAKYIDRLHFRPRLARNINDGAPVTNPHGKPPRSLAASLVKLAYFACVYNRDKWFSLNRNRNFTLRIWDRYYHDMLADPLRYRMGAPTWAVRLFGKLIPQPDLFLILDVAPEVARARKVEVSEEESERQFHAYRALAEELPGSVLIDANQAPQEVAAACEKAIVEAMARLVEKRMGGGR